jgi:hypothetical protein
MYSKEHFFNDLLLFGMLCNTEIMSHHFFSTSVQNTPLGQFKIIRTRIEWNISALGYVDLHIIFTEVLKFTERKTEPLYSVVRRLE